MKKIDYRELIKDAHKQSKLKICRACKIAQPLSEFHKNSQNKDGLKIECRTCSKVVKDAVCPFKKWYQNKKGHAKALGQLNFLEPIDIPGVKIKENVVHSFAGPTGRSGKYKTWDVIEYPQNCADCDEQMDWTMQGVQTWNSPSLDQLYPAKGYVRGNVKVICLSCNSAKLNCDPDEWIKINKRKARFILFGKR